MPMRPGGGWPRRAVIGSIAALVLVVPLRRAGAQDFDWKAGKLAHLAPLIGTYLYDRVLSDPTVRSALDALAGPDMPRIVANLDVASPIAFTDGCLVLQGNAPRRGGLDEAMVMVRVFDGTVRAALLHDGRMKLYARDREPADIPRILREFLRPRAAGPAAVSLPAGVDWIRGPR